MNGTYEISHIEKYDGLTEADSARIGRRLIIARLSVGAPAILPHADDPDKALVTSAVRTFKEIDGGNQVLFTTRNTTYILAKVSE